MAILNSRVDSEEKKNLTENGKRANLTLDLNLDMFRHASYNLNFFSRLAQKQQKKICNTVISLQNENRTCDLELALAEKSSLCRPLRSETKKNLPLFPITVNFFFPRNQL